MKIHCLLLLGTLLSAGCNNSPTVSSKKTALAPKKPSLLVSFENKASYPIDSLVLTINGGVVDIRSSNLRFKTVEKEAFVSEKIELDSSASVICAVKLYAKGEFLLLDAYAAQNRSYVPKELIITISDSANSPLIAMRDDKRGLYKPIRGK